MARIFKAKLSISMTPSVLVQLDKKRMATSRSAYIENLVRRDLK